jgi:predicted dehydrogenase
MTTGHNSCQLTRMPAPQPAKSTIWRTNAAHSIIANGTANRVSSGSLCGVERTGRKIDGLTRRALLSAALASQSLLAQKASSPIPLPRKVRLGMIGFDGHPEEILSHLPRLPDVELAAYAVDGTDPAALATNRKDPAVQKARSFDTYESLLGSEKLDLVAVCNNNGRRCGAILACAAKGIHVIAEKPLAMTTADLAKVKKAYTAPHLRLSMLLPMRFDPPYLALKAIVDSGEIGEIAQITGQKSYQLGERPEWQKHSSTYGSTMLWIGIHMIDLMRHCSGREFVEVAGYQSHVALSGYPEMENVTASVYKLDNGGVANLYMDYLRPAAASGHGDDRLRLAGTKGIAEYMESLGVTVMSEKSKPRVISSLPEPRSVFLDFIESVYLGKPQSLSLDDIYRTNEIAITTHNASAQHSFLPIQARRG